LKCVCLEDNLLLMSGFVETLWGFANGVFDLCKWFCALVDWDLHLLGLKVCKDCGLRVNPENTKYTYVLPRQANSRTKPQQDYS